MDRRSKTNTDKTTDAWLNALQAATDNQHELLYSDLSQHVTGRPEITGAASVGRLSTRGMASFGRSRRRLPAKMIGNQL